MVNLVPERQDEVSSSIGLDVILNGPHVKKVVRALKEVGVRVAVLVDPDGDQVKAAHTAEADAVLLNTRLYADTARSREGRDELDRLESAARVAHKLGLRVILGHGLDYHNAAAVSRIREVEALEVGHALIARSLFTGLERAVRELADLVAAGRSGPAS